MGIITLIELVIVVWVFACGYVYIKQADLLFFPDDEISGTVRDCEPFNRNYEQIDLNGTKLYLKEKTRSKVFVFYHGQVGVVCNLNEVRKFFETLDDYSLVFVEYRSYIDTSIKPSEKSLKTDVENVIEWLEGKNYSIEIISGWSLGSGPAAYHANQAEDTVDGIVLIAPFTSLLDAAKSKFWWLPIGVLLKHDFDNVAALQNIEIEKLVFSAEKDKKIPPRLQKELATKIDAEYVVLENAGHTSLYSLRKFQTKLMEFLRNF